MTEHPILFSAPMVRAILEGRKTMTRRVVKPQPFAIQVLQGGIFESSPDGGFDWGVKRIFCPYGQPGDRLWVRETWDFRSWERNMVRIAYGAGGLQEDRVPPSSWNPTVYNYDRWRPSIHMPRWASRITLEVTSVRVERVQDISEKDAKAEGAPWLGAGFLAKLGDGSYREGFYDLWDSINAKRGYGWDANPLVWVVEFKRIVS